MILTLLIGGVGGVFFHYAMLMGIQNGTVSKGARLWLQCVATPALMLAICATVITKYFDESVPYLLTLALWLLFVVALEPAYRLNERRVDTQRTEETGK